MISKPSQHSYILLVVQTFVMEIIRNIPILKVFNKGCAHTHRFFCKPSLRPSKRNYLIQTILFWPNNLLFDPIIYLIGSKKKHFLAMLFWTTEIWLWHLRSVYLCRNVTLLWNVKITTIWLIRKWCIHDVHPSYQPIGVYVSHVSLHNQLVSFLAKGYGTRKPRRTTHFL